VIVYSYYNFSTWLKNRNININESVTAAWKTDCSRFLEADKKKFMKARQFLTRARDYTQPQAKDYKRAVFFVAAIVLEILGTILLASFGISNVEMFMKKALETGLTFDEFKISTLIGVWKVVGWLVLGFVSSFIETLLDNKEEEKMKALYGNKQ